MPDEPFRDERPKRRPNGWQRWLLAIAAVLIAGLCGGLVTWGATQARLDTLETRQARAEERQDQQVQQQATDGRALASLNEQVRLLWDDVEDLRADIKDLRTAIRKYLRRPR